MIENQIKLMEEKDSEFDSLQKKYNKMSLEMMKLKMIKGL